MAVSVAGDATTPSTSAVIDGTLGNDGWYVSDVTVTLIATDDCSGVKEVRYTVDGGPEQAVLGSTASLTLTEDGIHTVTYWPWTTRAIPRPPLP